MHTSVVEFAKKLGVAPGQVTAALDELGLEVENGGFEADDDIIELLTEALAAVKGDKSLYLLPGVTPHDLAQAMGVTDKEVQMTLIKKFKVMATLTTSLADDIAENVAKEFDWEIKWGEPEKRVVQAAKDKRKEGAIPRPPVVTILGHVDHGKTSLLDYIRKANVVSKEHGGITQHIGAYQVSLPEGVITFLDTPGHAAFTAMRARGAQVTDIAILVVAADDGIMPQTKEAIAHVKQADVPIIVAANKIDLPTANIERINQQLTQEELVPVAYGGQIEVMPVSAHSGQGVPELLEHILLQAEIMELKADPKGRFEGVVIEAQLEKGRGPVATVLVQEGTLKVGDVIVAGTSWGKIKAMTDHKGDKVKEALPSMPVEILGLNEVPGAGDRVEPASSEKVAREKTDARLLKQRDESLNNQRRRVTLRDLRRQMDEEEIKDLNLIIKGDVQGSVEAVRGLIEKIENEEVRVKVLHSGVGSITESDILLASASNAICVGFNVKPEPKAKAEADRQKIEIRTYTIIYELIEDIEDAVKGMLEPKFEEDYHGKVEIRAVFKLTKAGKVAGSHVVDGKILRSDLVRVTRGTELVFAGKIESLRNVKQDVREMFAGQDCGLRFEGWDEFKEGDVVEAYEMVQVN